MAAAATHRHHSNALLCAKYCNSFQTWLELEEDPAVVTFIKKNLELLAQVGKEEMEIYANFMRETSPMLYNRFSHEGGMLGSICEFGRLIYKESLDPFRVNAVCERLMNLMKRLLDICDTLRPIMSFLKDVIEFYGFVQLIPVVRELYLGTAELILALRDWTAALLATLTSLEVDEGHRYVSNFFVVAGNELDDIGSARAIWGSTFTKFWEAWTCTKTAIVEVCHRSVVAIVVEGLPADALLTDKSLGMFVKVMDRLTNAKRLWAQLKKEIEIDPEKTEDEHEAAAASIRNKFSWGNRLSQISVDFYAAFNELSEIMKETNGRILNSENTLNVESPAAGANSNAELVEAAQRVKTKLDLYVSCVEIISSSGRHQQQPSKPRPSPEPIFVKAKERDEAEAEFYSSSDETYLIPEPGVFTNTSRNLMEDSDFAGDDDYDTCNDEFFQSRGGGGDNLGHKDKVTFGDDDDTNVFAQASFRNVVSELKDKLTDVKENMSIREKNALKKYQGDQEADDEISSDEELEKTLVEVEDFKDLDLSKSGIPWKMSTARVDEDELDSLAPPSGQGADFGTELRMVMSQLKQKESETEEFECLPEFECADIE